MADEQNETTDEQVEATGQTTPEAPAAARADAVEARGEGAADAAAASEEQLTAKQRTRRNRAARRSGRPARTPEERREERAQERARKATQRRKRRLSEREQRKSEPAPEPDHAPEHGPGRAKTRQGIVVSDKADKTITVRIDVARRHRRYGKIIRSSTTLQAHDERNDAHAGDTVRIVESRPLSRTKRWRLVEILERAK